MWVVEGGVLWYVLCLRALVMIMEENNSIPFPGIRPDMMEAVEVPARIACVADSLVAHEEATKTSFA